MTRISPPLRRTARKRTKSLFARWRLAMLTAMVLNNLWWALRLALGRITSHSFATHSASSVEESVAYIRGVFEDYKRYGSVERFRGSVAEVGPGDNAGVALLVRADGAETVDLVDRYAAWLDPAQQARIYERLAQQYPNVDTLREGRSWRDCVHSGIAWHTGRPAEKHFRDHAQHGGLYDFILSRAVMEHLYDPLDGLHAMILAVRPGGRLIHKIDLRDHELFSPPGHPLTWLTIPRWTWQLATRYSGHPNRVLLHRYRQALETMQRNGLIRYRILVTQMAGVGEILPHRPIEEVDPATRGRAVETARSIRHRLAAEFHAVSDEDLAVTGVFLVAERCG